MQEMKELSRDSKRGPANSKFRTAPSVEPEALNLTIKNGLKRESKPNLDNAGLVSVE